MKVQLMNNGIKLNTDNGRRTDSLYEEMNGTPLDANVAAADLSTATLYYIYINKRLWRVDKFISNVKEKYGARIYTLFKGSVKICSTYSRKQCIEALLNGCVVGKNHKQYRAQGLFSSIKRVYNQFSNDDSSLNTILGLFPVMEDLFKSTIKAAPSILKILWDSLMSIIDVMNLYTSVSNLIENRNDTFVMIVNMLNVVQSIYSLFHGVYVLMSHKNDIEKSSLDNSSVFDTIKNSMRSGRDYISNSISELTARFRSQSGFEEFTFAAIIETFLPSNLRNIFRAMSFYTKNKILDDTTYVHSIAGFLFDLPIHVMQLLKINPEYINGYRDIQSFFPYSRLSYHEKKINSFVMEYEKDMRKVCDKNYQDSFIEYYSEFEQWSHDYIRVKDSHPRLKNLFDRFKGILSQIKYQVNKTRVEPVCVVLGGKRGTGKSVLSSKMMAMLADNNSIYVHSSPPSGSKDFYDNYHNEDVFFVDDIGQKGIEQWGNIINMVSNIHYPLECAAVEMKGVKSFTSDLIITSTNNVNLSLKDNSGISDLGALHRRLMYFDFDHVDFDGSYTGTLYYKKYNLSTSKFEIQTSIRLDTLSYDDISTWILQIAKIKMDENVEHFNKLHGSASRQFGKFRSQVKFSKNSDNSYQVDLDSREAVPLQVNYCVASDKVDFSGVVDDKDVFSRLFSYIESNKVYASVFGVAVPIITMISIIFYKLIKKKILKHRPNKVTRDIVHSYKSDNVVKSNLKHFRPQVFEEHPMVKALFDVPRMGEESDEQSIIQDSLKIKKNVVVIELISYDPKTKETVDGAISCALISGLSVVTTAHGVDCSIGQELYIRVYTSGDHIVYDYVPCLVKYINYKDDTLILRLRSPQPPYFKKCRFKDGTTEKRVSFITPNQSHHNLPQKNIREVDFTDSYKIGIRNHNVECKISPGDLEHDISMDGLCGSILITIDGFLLGHHVAGSNSTGIIKMFTQSTIDAITLAFNSQSDYYLSLSDSHPGVSINQISGFIPDNINHSSVIVPSLMDGVHSRDRVPANLNAYGKDTVAVMSSKSFQKVGKVDIKSLNYAVNIIKESLPKHFVIDEKSAILGGNGLNKLRMDTSCGVGFINDKHLYIDDVNGLMLDPLLLTVSKTVLSMLTNEGTYNSWSHEVLKDELRNIEKVDKPRLFKVNPLDLLILQRMFLGEFSVASVQNRFESGMMIGINVFSEDWKRLYDRVTQFGDNQVFDGDYETWDGKMHTLFQFKLQDCVIEKVDLSSCARYLRIHPSMHLLYKDAGFKIVDGHLYMTDDIIFSIYRYLFSYMHNTPTISNGRKLITTHSMPSGILLTALYNCIVNLMYNAYAFCKLYYDKYKELPSIMTFKNNVKVNDYGDDLLNGVSKQYSDIFNGVTYSKVMAELGVGFTTGDKRQWTGSGLMNIKETTFLKRSFRCHPELGLVAPLDFKSRNSTLNYVKDDFRNEELTIIKCLNFQRECYLDHENYEMAMLHVMQYAIEKGLDVPWLTKSELKHLYITGGYIDLLPMS
jgi:hypothetical protein